MRAIDFFLSQNRRKVINLISFLKLSFVHKGNLELCLRKRNSKYILINMRPKQKLQNSTTLLLYWVFFYMFNHDSNIYIFGTFLVRLYSYNIIRFLVTVKQKFQNQNIYIFTRLLLRIFRRHLRD